VATRKHACAKTVPTGASTFIVLQIIKSEQVRISFILKRASAFARLGIQSNNQKDERLLLKDSIRGRCDFLRDFRGDRETLRLWTRPEVFHSYSGSSATAGFRY